MQLCLKALLLSSPLGRHLVALPAHQQPQLLHLGAQHVHRLLDLVPRPRLGVAALLQRQHAFLMAAQRQQRAAQLVTQLVDLGRVPPRLRAQLVDLAPEHRTLARECRLALFVDRPNLCVEKATALVCAG